MFSRFRRAIVKATKLARSGRLISATAVIQKLVAAPSKPARKKRVTATPRKAAAAKPKPTPTPKTALQARDNLGETVRKIKAGGMPALPDLPRVKPVTRKGASFRTASFSSDQGKRSYKLYLPAAVAGRQGRMPLLVMLHGCAQTPDDFATGTGMNALAEEFGLLIAYPAQPTGANANKCWNWFKPSDQARDSGEPSLIAGIARTILRDHPVDPARVYVAGLSAGGAAAATVASAYPDLFAAMGVHSGLPAGAAHDAATAFLAMRQGTPGRRLTVAMPTIIFHGDADSVVHPRNGRSVAARALAGFPS